MAGSDYHFNEKKIVSIPRILAFEKALYQAGGMSPEDADCVARCLVEADARGVYSHGIQRNSLYFNRFEQHGTDPAGRPGIARQFGATALVDGGNAMGMVVGEYGMNLAIDLARKYGTSAVSITGSNHFGTCAHYLQMAADAGMVAFVWTINCVNIMAPWGGTQRQLGNNPFGIGAPCGDKPAVILDMATSVVARGKIVMARKTHAPIPETWALDVDGHPTTDAEKAYWGTVQPFGGYKGYGLTLMNAIVSAILNNSSFGPDIIDLYEEPGKLQNSGHLFQVVDIRAIDDLDAFKKRMDAAVDYIKNGPKAPGVSEIFVPGEIEANNQKKAQAEGIVYPVEVLEENRVLARRYGLDEALMI